MGAEPKDRAGAGDLHARGRAHDHWETATERGGWEMDLSYFGGGHARGGVLMDPEDRHKEEECGCTVHCDATDYGPL